MIAGRVGYLVFALTMGSAGAGAERFQLVWPTPHQGWAEGRPTSQWLQHAGSGDPASGGFGGVRSAGRQFHEGIDIRPVTRDRRGEALDSVFAAMAGVVRHASSAAGASSYGRYVVLEHPAMTPAVYTLYAHLARLAPGVRVGQAVAAGEVLGVMGHSSGGYSIPAARAHLHFEIGLVLTHQFQSWYDRQKYGSRNEQGIWNGLNLMGVDPLTFYSDWREGRISSAQEFFARMNPAVRLRIATMRIPDFIARYPSLLTHPRPLGLLGGWEIRFNWTGLPYAWTPLSPQEVSGLRPEVPIILEVNAAIERRERSKSLAVSRRGSWVVGSDLDQVLRQLFVQPKAK